MIRFPIRTAAQAAPVTALLLVMLLPAPRETEGAGLPVAAAVTAAAGNGTASAPQGKVDFNYDIRPILSTKCFHCHGADEGARKAHLRLDSREEAMKEHEDLRAIVPGNVEASEIAVRIASQDPDEMMPPPKENKRLTESEAALLKLWIAQGAEYKPHWSFVKPERPAIPPLPPLGAGAQAGVRLEDWTRNPIDHFILARMTAAGLQPSPPADARTLCRRMYLDLTGLPPTPAEAAAFAEAEKRDRRAAVGALADELLTSPGYGEKWARMWLDLARYADSTGYGSDKFRLNIWPWRDWVINAFNRNLPFDQFTTEQLAGDLIPNAKPEQILATAFHRNTMTNVEGGVIAEEYRVAAVKDRISTTAEVWMGLTMQCAQCHSHKFDPISQKEYYQFFGVFNETQDANREDEEPKLALATPEQQKETAALQAEVEALEKKMKEGTPELAAEERRWEEKMRAPVEWQPLETLEATSTAEMKLTARPDGSLFAEGGSGAGAVYTVKARTKLKGITAIKLEALTDPALPQNGPGRSLNGNAVLSRFSATAAPLVEKPPVCRYVRIEAPGKRRILSLAEVQLWHGTENVALAGKATQSSTDFNGEANRAIDGKTDGDFAKQSVTHTRESDDPWWEVDLGAEKEVEKIVLWNRTDGGTGTRLANALILFLDGARKPLAELNTGSAPGEQLELTPIAGRRTVAFRSATADFSQEGYTIESAIEENAPKVRGWGFVPELGKPHEAIFETTAPVGDGESILTFKLEQLYGDNHLLGRFRLSATTQPAPPPALPGAIRSILATAEGQRTAEQRQAITAFFLPRSPQAAALKQEIDKKNKAMAAIKPVQTPVMRELAAGQKRETHLLVKGNYLSPGEKLEPGLPAAFSSWMSGAGAAAPDRMTVAQWLLSPENPLTARVTVNRFWAQLFGTGIVETEEDFGTQGALPTHPELLDWLAVTFESPRNRDPQQAGLGWDMKALLKLMVTSATYGQSSKISAESEEKDARDRYLSHYPRRRLEAETVRDQALALSGLLSKKIGGPSVYPPQPAGLWSVAFNGGQNGYPTSTGEDRYRRGLYTFWRRTSPYPSMTTFDAPSRETCTLRRLPTNTPLQAFVTLNDPCFVECAQALARRIVREGGPDTESRMRWALELTLGRPPTPEQTGTLRKLLDAELAAAQANPAGAKQLAGAEIATAPRTQGAQAALPESDANALAAWTVVANVLLNLDATLTKS